MKSPNHLPPIINMLCVFKSIRVQHYWKPLWGPRHLSPWNTMRCILLLRRLQRQNALGNLEGREGKHLRIWEHGNGNQIIYADKKTWAWKNLSSSLISTIYCWCDPHAYHIAIPFICFLSLERRVLIVPVHTPCSFCDSQIHSFIQQMFSGNLSHARHSVHTGDTMINKRTLLCP